MPEEIKPGETTASARRQAELDKPVGSRNSELIERLNAATRATNLMNAELKKAGKETGLAPSELKAEPNVDNEGKVVGYTVS